MNRICQQEGWGSVRLRTRWWCLFYVECPPGQASVGAWWMVGLRESGKVVNWVEGGLLLLRRVLMLPYRGKHAGRVWWMVCLRELIN